MDAVAAVRADGHGDRQADVQQWLVGIAGGLDGRDLLNRSTLCGQHFCNACADAFGSASDDRYLAVQFVHCSYTNTHNSIFIKTMNKVPAWIHKPPDLSDC